MSQQVPALRRLCFGCRCQNVTYQIQRQHWQPCPPRQNCHTYSTSTTTSDANNSATTKRKANTAHATNPSPQLQSPPVNSSPPSNPDALARVLSSLTDSSTPSDRPTIEHAGFDPTLRDALLARISSTTSSSLPTPSQHASSVVNLPSFAGSSTRATAAAAPWTGRETLPDTAHRMLQDGKKPARVARGEGGPGGSVAARIAAARDRATDYATAGGAGDRAELRDELRERFRPAGRAVAGDLGGLSALANRRIEEAMSASGGRFVGVRRGKGVVISRGEGESSKAYIDTTEYLMNSLIQKQDMRPPWIEKQRELGIATRTFRERLRREWRRHAARMISARRGEEAIRWAENYARAEKMLWEKEAGGPTAVPPTITPGDHLSPISLSGQLSPPPPSSGVSPLPSSSVDSHSNEHQSTSTSASLPPPFRDAVWESTERGYHTLAIRTINDQTRSYNLMAPSPAQRPYLNLARELRNCYRDVAPLVADEIRQRRSSGRWVEEEGGGVLAGPGGSGSRWAPLSRGGEKGGWWRDLWRGLWDGGSSAHTSGQEGGRTA